jgi:SAM-dependent methyltransferase
MDKEAFYSKDSVVDRYENRRFGGKSGRHVNHRELSGVLDLLPPPPCKLLDCPVGTGRLSLFLQEKGYDCHGLDYSKNMLALSRNRGLLNLKQGDVFTMTMETGFDAVVSLRFLFHFKELSKIFEQVHTCLNDGGIYVFDTLTRSPRSWWPGLHPERRVHLHSDNEIKQLATSAGFEVEICEHSFFFSPLIYRCLPYFLIRMLERMEGKLPSLACVRRTWRLRKIARPLSS